MLEYAPIIISCAVAILFYGVTVVNAAFIYHMTLNWSRLKNRKKPWIESI